VAGSSRAQLREVEWAPQSPVAPGDGALPFLYIDQYAWEAWATQT